MSSRGVGYLSAMLTLTTCALSSVLLLGTDQALRFDPSKFAQTQATLGETVLKFRAAEGIVYVAQPVDAKYQTLYIYVPEAYFNGQTVNGYTSKTAPIFLPNSIGGYMPGAAQRPDSGRGGTLLKALARGYVVVAPGARGRTLTDANGKFTGKAPAAIVDLKATVRYVRFNRGFIPGNTDRIVSNGTSAGGAMSALLGATGNSKDYAPFLKALGAADAADDIWAVSAYCPITNLDNADIAYEWLLNGVNESKRFGPGGPGGFPPGGGPGGPPPGMIRQGGGNPFGQPNSSSGKMNDVQIANSAELKAAFPSYVNNLKLKSPDGKLLTLDKDGNGSFKDYVKSLLLQSAQKAFAKGADLSKTSWATLDGGKPVDIDWDGFVKDVGRMKQTSAFDSPALTTGENNLFGNETIDNRHFTAFGMAKNTVAGASLAEPQQVKMLNPMNYIGTKGAKVARYWRIRHGAIDRDTSVAIPAILALKLQKHQLDVDLAFPWNTPHSGDYDLDELFDWIDAHAK